MFRKNDNRRNLEISKELREKQNSNTNVPNVQRQNAISQQNQTNQATNLECGRDNDFRNRNLNLEVSRELQDKQNQKTDVQSVRQQNQTSNQNRTNNTTQPVNTNTTSK